MPDSITSHRQAASKSVLNRVKQVRPSAELSEIFLYCRWPCFIHVEKAFCYYELYFRDQHAALYLSPECGMNISMLSSIWAPCPWNTQRGLAGMAQAAPVELSQPRSLL